MPWFPGENNPWRLQTAVTHDGQDAAASPTFANGIVAMVTRLDSRVIGPGRLSFWWRIAAEGDASSQDFGALFPTGLPTDHRLEEDFKSPAPLWRQEEAQVAEGVHDVSWSFYTWGGCTTPGVATAYLDEVHFTPDLMITGEPCDQKVGFAGTTSLNVAVTGGEPLVFQWFYGESGQTTARIAGASDRSLCLTNLQEPLRVWVQVQSGGTVVNSRSAAIEILPRLEHGRVTDGTFVVIARGAPGSRWQVEASTDLVSWQPVSTIDPIEFQASSIPLVLQLKGPSGTFYRLSGSSP